ncbi:MAG: MBL fold metallo-hydrolase [Candidatus Hodarchaeota archaeon]
MEEGKIVLRFYPVSNGDSCLIENEDGKHFLIDYNCSTEAESDEDDRIFLEDELDERLKDKNLDVLMITHSHEDHFKGFSEYFWLNCAATYQSEERKKFTELWVPDALIWEPGVIQEGKLLRKEARYRLLDEKKGIKVFGESNSLIDFIENSGKATYDEVKHLIYKPGETVKYFKGFDIFIHSPHSWRTEEDENKNNKCIVIQIDFQIDSQSVAKAIFGSDAESDAWANIYSSTENNNNLIKLEFDIFKLAHHCSHTALNKEEKGDLITDPVENVKRLFEEQGNSDCFLIASCDQIPSKEKRDETGPPHYQAAEYYRKVEREKDGEFKVTMEQTRGPKNKNPIVIEITRYGPRIMHLATAAIGGRKITSTRSERHGK